jgi:hypothetical protein
VNTVLENEAALKSRNYVRKSNPKKKNYWFYWSRQKVESIRTQTNDNFCFIIYGDPEDRDDFFVIPFSKIRHLLTPETLVERESDTPDRWNGEILDKKLKITHTGQSFDLTNYYGNHRLLGFAIHGIVDPPDPRLTDLLAGNVAADEADNYLPTTGDTRRSALHLIRERRGQQKFRNILRDRYGNRCLISGCTIMDIVEAAHIKPYRRDEDNNASNGLLLRTDLHTLYDLHLLGIEPGTLTVRLKPKAMQEPYNQFEGVKLLCKESQVSRDALDFRWRLFRGLSNATEATAMDEDTAAD